MMSSPVFFTGAGASVALAAVALLKLLLRYHAQPLFWMVLILMLVAGIFTLAIRLLLTVRGLRHTDRLWSYR